MIPYFLLSICFLILALGVYFYYHQIRARILKWIIISAVFISFLLYAIYAAAFYFAPDNLEQALNFYLTVGLKGSPSILAYPSLTLRVALILLIGLAITGWLIFNHLNKDRKGAYLTIGFISLSLVFNPVPLLLAKNYLNDHFLAYYSDDLNTRDTLRDMYLEPMIVRTGKPKNLVFIYTESLERTFFKETVFPGLVPNLKGFKQSSVDFTDIDQLSFSYHTIAGMIASQCGLPLAYPQGLSRYETESLIADENGGVLSNATCLSDLLTQAGYHTSFYGGADLSFANKGNFLNTHQFDEIYGRSELKPRLTDPDHLNSWGLYDDSLYPIVYEELEKTAGTQERFALFLLTLDTHHPTGHPSASCKDLQYQDGQDPFLNAVACSDLLLSRFIKRIRNSEFSDETVIVIASDHLALKNSADPLLNSTERRNLFLVNLPNSKQGSRVQTGGLLLDIAPTVLSYLGFDAQLAFGRDLTDISKSRTPARETLPSDLYERELRHFLTDQLWSLEKDPESAP